MTLRQADNVYESGDSGRALQLLDDAIAAAASGDATLRADLLLQKAAWRRQSGYSDAAAALADAAAEVECLPQRGNETEWAWLRTEQGLAAQRRGDLKMAETLAAEAADLAQRSSARDVLRTDIYAAQASLYLAQGRFGDARDALFAALKIDQRVGNRRSESNDLNMLGQVFNLLGDADTAIVYLRKAFMTGYENGLIREATDAMTNLAAMMDDAGDHTGAAAIFRDIGHLQAEGGDKSAEACSTANQGVAAWLAGDLETAATLLSRSQEMHLAVGHLRHTVNDLVNLSGVEAQRGQLDKALGYAEQARAAATEFGLVELLWAAEATVAKCRVRWAAGLDDRSERVQALQEALTEYRRAADLVELLRAQVSRPEERESLLANKESIYDEAIQLCNGLSQGKSAFQFSERARMRSFLEALGSARLQRLDQDSPAAQRRAVLTERLLSRLTPPAEKPGLLEQLRMLRAETMASHPQVAAITEAGLPSVEEISAAIPPGTYVLEFFEFEHTQDVLAYLLDREGLKDAMSLHLDEPLGALVERFRDEIKASDPNLPTGSKLFSLVRMFLPLLATTSNLIIVPHRSLHRLPFSALWDEVARGGSSRCYLKNRFHLATAPSASYLPYLARAAVPANGYGPPLVLGNPTGDLKNAGAEAETVAGQLGVTAVLGPSATRRAFLEAGTPLVLHLAGHGQYDKMDPMLSGLELADGRVTVEELLSSGPAPALLVLSGCVTGISERRPGDELVGLAQAALRNGTRSVVATLWETSDDSSARFFASFYAALLDGATAGEAITRGRNALASSPDGYDQPIEWAPFLLIGDPWQRLTGPGLNASDHDSRPSRRDRLMAAIAARLNQISQSSDLLLALAPEAAEDARVLAELLDDAEYADAIESRYLIGWLYWYRGLAAGGSGEQEANLRIAKSRLLPGFMGGVTLEQLPQPLLPALADVAEGMAQERLQEAYATIDLPFVRGVGELWRRIVASTDAGHADRGRRLAYLGLARRRQFECSGQLADLNEAVQALQLAITAIPAGDPNLAGQLANLGRVQQLRYQYTGDTADLNESITNFEHAVRAGAVHPDLAQYQTSLGVALRLRFEQAGDRSDLAEAVRVGRESVAATQADHPELAMCKSNLANTLLVRFDRLGTTDDLDEAVQLGREALAAAPAGHGNRGMCTINLAAALRGRSQHSGSLADIREAVQLGRDAVAAVPVNALDGAMAAAALGNALRMQYQITAAAADLDEAVDHLRQALDALPAGQVERARIAADLRKAVNLR